MQARFPSVLTNSLTLAAALALAACSSPPAEPRQDDSGQPAPASPATKGDTTPPPPPAASGPPGAKSTPETTVATDAEQPRLRESKKVSAFDSNQWNSAVGGLAGDKIRGRRALRYSGRSESTESYAEIRESGFFVADDAPLSTFAADVDTASYANVRRMLSLGQKPDTDAVRVEEFVNAMDYRDPEPRGNEPFAVTSEVAPCPWNEGHELLRIGLKTREIDASKVPPCNLVFLIDVSGSMRSAKKLPLVKRAMGLLVDQMRPQDRVAIVTCAGRVGVPLESTNGDAHDKIHAVLTNLRTGGGTNGQGGIQRAYEIAAQNRAEAGINRVILCTDGDFNVGIQEPDALEKFITEKRDTGVFLTVLGVGGGNLKDDRLERLANKGNGVYAYLDTLAEARRVLVEQFGASMMTVAKDVKLQVEFDPKRVAGYRLIGYENRVMAAKDFRDDKKDAGEIGAGHAMTALYEIVPFGMAVPGTEAAKTATANAAMRPTSDLAVATLRLRYKPPHGDTAREKTFGLGAGNGEGGGTSHAPSRDHRLASAAAAFGMLLRGSKHLGQFGWADLAAMIDDADLGAPGLRTAIDQARKVLTD